MTKYEKLLIDGACEPIIYRINAETLKKVIAFKKKVGASGTRI